MRRIAFLSLFLLCLVGCKKDVSTYTLKGVYENGNDTLYLFGIDSRHDKIDTVTTKADGSFTYTLVTDTIVPLTLLMPNGEMLQLFAEPNINATMKKESNGWKINGSNIQQQYDSVASTIDTLKNIRQIYDVIDSFSIHNPYSEINVPLLRQHFIEVGDIRKIMIRDRITRLGGTLQDNSYLSLIKRKVNNDDKNISRRTLPAFTMKLNDSTQITQAKYKNKYLLITFCASWDTIGMKTVKEINKIGAQKDTADFAMLNISLDYDTAHWNRSVATDSIAGDNTCDTKMWGNDLIKKYEIESLPFNILVNPYQRIHRFNITPQYLREEADSLITKYKKEQKEREERKKRNLKRK